MYKPAVTDPPLPALLDRRARVQSPRQPVDIDGPSEEEGVQHDVLTAVKMRAHLKKHGPDSCFKHIRAQIGFVVDGRQLVAEHVYVLPKRPSSWQNPLLPKLRRAVCEACPLAFGPSSRRGW
eukprot:9313192-Pyramimonas_sp.AAC.1